MNEEWADFWTDETSVLFTAFDGWSPETWGAVGFTGPRGEGRRRNLIRDLTDPFITVACAPAKQSVESDLRGRINGFYLVSHQTGDRDEFTHPLHHAHQVESWRHSLKALRAFNYLPEYRPLVAEFEPSFVDSRRSIASMGKVITDRAMIDRLRSIPWIEVPVYSQEAEAGHPSNNAAIRGMTFAGPASKHGYAVAEGVFRLPRELYVLRFEGDTDAYLGAEAQGRSIYKIGLSVSPEMRRQTFQRSMPRGAYRWVTDRTTSGSGFERFANFGLAEAGEYTMKEHLARVAEWLGGEFYLADAGDIEIAWLAAHAPPADA